MRFSTRYVTVETMQADYAKQIREFERRYAYERNIVSSVPVSSIEAVSADVPTTDREEPG